ncbi:hypothetical protein [Streptomyces sp. RFCAC02]|uniref:hypothetical protein n=1 Tax=Streptomyces sp. RFCAC02 TaxID=2499143 RepID=UPI001021B724|nr:hypothetical protein [Streptomyces sp. RFCAC02]
MKTDAQWYVLVEADGGWGTESEWVLAEKHRVEGNREAALSRAEEICRTHPVLWDLEESGRAVFQTSESSWLVEVTHETWNEHLGRPSTLTEHFRVTVGLLVHTRETPPAAPPGKKPGVLRRAFGGER